MVELYEAAAAGRCEEVRGTLSALKEEGEPFAFVAAGEFHDAGLCLPFDPALAHQSYLRAGAVAEAPLMLVTGWNLWWGRGAPMNRDAAEDAFRDWALRFLPYGMVENDAVVDEALLQRPRPAALEEALRWARGISTASEAEQARFGLDLAFGRAHDWRGRAISASPDLALTLLRDVAKDLPAVWYELGKEILEKAPPGFELEDGVRNLRHAAGDCHGPAALALGQAYETGRAPLSVDFEFAYYYYQLARSLGADVGSSLERTASQIEEWRRPALPSEDEMKESDPHCHP